MPTKLLSLRLGAGALNINVKVFATKFLRSKKIPTKMEVIDSPLQKYVINLKQSG